MNQERLLKVILAPVVSEKSNMLAEKRNQMVFKVLKDATSDVKKAYVSLVAGQELDLEAAAAAADKE